MSSIFNKPKQAKFLDALTEFGDLDLACQRAGVAWQVVYLKRRECSHFRAAWAEIIAQAFCLHVNGVPLRRAK